MTQPIDLTIKDNSYYSASRKDMLKFIPKQPERILEIGCGQGHFSSHFPNCEYWGVEPNASMANFARANGLHVTTGLYEDVALEIPNDYFDLIVCNDVIEHMRDPKAFLAEVKSKLRKHGFLIASVPNIKNIEVIYDLMLKDKFEYVKSGLMDYTHLHFFTVTSFKKMASECGWNTIICEPISMTKIKFWKSALLKIIEFFVGGLRTYQFGVTLTPDLGQ